MRRIAWPAAAVAAVTTGVLVGRRIVARNRPWAHHRDGAADDTRWHAVTVNRPEADIRRDGALPEPLARLGDAVEVRLRPAPGGKGTELAARLRAGEPSGVSGAVARLTDTDPRRDLRRALREAKQLVETGEILRPDRPSSNEETLLNRPLAYAVEHGREEGRL
jgi:hypothetical protein